MGERAVRCFLYFIEGAVGLSEKVIEGAGLGYAVDMRSAWGQIAQGPGGVGGLLVLPWHGVPEGERDGGSVMEVSRLRQDWYRLTGQDGENGERRVWLGVVKGHAPGPLDLARADGCDLNLREVLGDGGAWYLPVARPATLVKTLPRCFGLDGEGRGTTEVQSGFLPIEELAERLYASVSSGAGLGIESDDEMVRAASLCLGVNYRVSEAECRALRLWTRRTLQICLLGLIDYGTWGMEKNGGDGGKGGSGSAVD